MVKEISILLQYHTTIMTALQQLVSHFYYILYAFCLSLSLYEGNISLVQRLPPKLGWIRSGQGVARSAWARRNLMGCLSVSHASLFLSAIVSPSPTSLSLSDWRLTQAQFAIILPSNAKPRPPLATVSPSNDCEISSVWVCSEISSAIMRSLQRL